MKRTQFALAAVALSVGGLLLWRSREGAPNPALVDLARPVAVSPPVAADPTPKVEAAKPVDPPAATSAPKVDIVFALDTTGSMSAMLAGAKAKIWEVARRAQQGQPAPELRVGLVAYRDVHDAYVTRVVDLTSDLDSVYARLTELRAEGGGDTPEHVLKGLHDAFDEEHWSQDANAVKLVYLVGDAPPHTDYKDGLTLDAVLADATKKGIRVSAIRCGEDRDTLAAWTEIARRTDGEVATIAQSGGVASVATPFDGELARLNAALARTEVRYGSADERRAAAATVATNLEASPAAQADRVSFYGAAAASKMAPTKKDLAASAGPAPLASVAPSDLPEEMQAMSDDQRARFVADKQAERSRILNDVKVASAKREAYLATSAPPPAPTSLDAKVFDSLKKAGARKGIAY